MPRQAADEIPMMTDPETKPPELEPRVFGLTLRQRLAIIYLTSGAVLALVVAIWVDGYRPQLCFLASPPWKPTPPIISPEIGTILIRSDGKRKATNVVCTLSNCVPQEIRVGPAEIPAAVEKRPDGATVRFPVLNPGDSAAISVVLAEGSTYTEEDVSVTGDGVVGRPFLERESSLLTQSLFVVVPAYLLVSVLLWGTRRARRRPS